MKTAQTIAAKAHTAAVAIQAAEALAIALDQNWTLEMTKYTFDDNSVLAVRNMDALGFDADDAESIRAYADWLGADIDDAEQAEVDRLIEAVNP